MIVSDLMLTKLNAVSNNDAMDERKGASQSPLRLIVWGIRCGHIKGAEAELRQFILQYLTDPKEIEVINGTDENATNLISDLFRAYSFCSDEEKINILIAFRVLFEKNPFSITNSILLDLEDEEQKWTESAIERIGDLNLQEELKPELLRFIREYASQLSETKLRRFVYGVHTNQELMQQLMRSFPLESNNYLLYERNALSATELQHAISTHWHPDHKQEVAFFYDDFPVVEMWRLFMDGDQQKNGWKYYEAREKGCINQLYQAWVYVCQTMDKQLTTNYFKNIHAICARNIIWRWEENSGVHRERQPKFSLSTNSMSFLGYLEHIQHYNALCVLEKHPRLGFDAQSKISTDKLDSTIEDIIKEYESALLANSENLKVILQAIILFCKKLVLIHPFIDCNGRLFCNLILNRELIRNGFSPTLLDDPNRIDGNSINESLYELIRGMDNFQQLKTTGLFKDSMSTAELMKTETYPIPDILSLFEQSKDKANGAAKLLSQYGVFTAPKEYTSGTLTKENTAVGKYINGV